MNALVEELLILPRLAIDSGSCTGGIIGVCAQQLNEPPLPSERVFPQRLAPERLALGVLEWGAGTKWLSPASSPLSGIMGKSGAFP